MDQSALLSSEVVTRVDSSGNTRALLLLTWIGKGHFQLVATEPSLVPQSGSSTVALMNDAKPDEIVKLAVDLICRAHDLEPAADLLTLARGLLRR